MATIEQEQDKKKGYGEEQPTSPTVAPAITSQYTSPKSEQRTGTGRFTNIQKYLSANTGAGQQLGQQIGQKAEQQAEQVRKGIESARTQFGQQAAPEQQRLAGAGQFIQQSLQAPQNLSQEQIKQYQDLASGQLAAPTLNLAQQQQQAQQLQQTAKAGQTETGRYDLLRQTFGTPSYTQGQRRLDQLFLQTQSPEQLQRRLQQAAAGATGGVTQAQSDLGSQLQQLQQAAQEAQTAAQTGAQTQQEQLLSQGQQLGQERTAEQQGLYDVLRRALSGGRITEEEMASAQQRLAGAPQQFQGALGIGQIDPTLLLGAAPEAVGLGGALGQEGIAKLNVLQQLTGQPIAGLPSKGQDYSASGFLNPERLTSLQQVAQQQLQSSTAPIQQQLQTRAPLVNAATPLLQAWSSGAPVGTQMFALENEIRGKDPAGWQRIMDQLPPGYTSWGGNEFLKRYVADQTLQQQLQTAQTPYNRSLSDILRAATQAQGTNSPSTMENFPTVG